MFSVVHGAARRAACGCQSCQPRRHERRRARREAARARQPSHARDALRGRARGVRASPRRSRRTTPARCTASRARTSCSVSSPKRSRRSRAFRREASSEAKARVGRLDQLFAELRSRVGTLQLSCNVKGARVLVRDKLIGTTPLPADAVARGLGHLGARVRRLFHAAQADRGALRRDAIARARLHARSQVGLLVVRTVPGGALVSVDGSAQGTSSPSIELALPAGPHRVSATRQGYDDASVPVVLSAGVIRNAGHAPGTVRAADRAVGGFGPAPAH